jgi:hypothetical protein
MLIYGEPMLACRSPAGREKCLVVVNSAADEQQVDVDVQLQSPGGPKHAAYTVCLRAQQCVACL